MVNVSAAEQATEIKMSGHRPDREDGRVSVLTSASTADENSLERPTKVAPVTRTVANPGPTFRHAFPANSVTVIRLPASR